MDVSNSTGESTDYKVTAKPGGEPEYLCGRGQLGPEPRVSCKTSGGPVTVEFYVEGKLVACQTFETEPALVRLRNEGKYWIERVDPFDLAQG